METETDMGYREELARRQQDKSQMLDHAQRQITATLDAKAAYEDELEVLHDRGWSRKDLYLSGYDRAVKAGDWPMAVLWCRGALYLNRGGFGTHEVAEWEERMRIARMVAGDAS